MTSYSAFSKSENLKRLYWITGSEHLLKYLAVEQIKALSPATFYNTHIMVAGETPEAELWDTLHVYPVDAEKPKLVIVYDAHLLYSIEELIPLLAKSKATYVFVSDHPIADETVAEKIKKSSSAATIECALPITETSRTARAVELLCSWYGKISTIQARILLDVTGGNLLACYNVIRKSAVLGIEVTPDTIKALTPPLVTDSFVDHLLAGHRGLAMDIHQTYPQNPNYLMTVLPGHLETLTRINTYTQGSRMTVRQIAQALDLNENYVRNIVPHTSRYPAADYARRLAVLGRMESMKHLGVKAGLVESLIATW